MEENKRLSNQIKFLARIGVTMVVLFFTIALISGGTLEASGMSNEFVFVSLAFQNLVWVYLFSQIINLCNVLNHTINDNRRVSALFSEEIRVYIRHIAYACFVKGIGGSIMESIQQSQTSQSLSISIQFVALGAGVLTLVVGSIFFYGFEQNKGFGEHKY